MQIFGTEGFASVNMADHTVRSIRYPRWLKQQGFDFQSANPRQQNFIRENLFTRILPVEEIQPPKANAILEEQKQWIGHLAGGSEMINTGSAAAQAVRIAAQILDQIDDHDWGLPKILPFDSQEHRLPEELTNRRKAA